MIKKSINGLWFSFVDVLDLNSYWMNFKFTLKLP